MGTWISPPAVTSIMVRNEKEIDSQVFFHQSRRGPRVIPDLTNLRASMGSGDGRGESPLAPVSDRAVILGLADPDQREAADAGQRDLEHGLDGRVLLPGAEGHGRQGDGQQEEARDVEIPSRRDRGAVELAVRCWILTNRAMAAAAMRTNIMIVPIENRILRISCMASASRVNRK